MSHTCIAEREGERGREGGRKREKEERQSVRGTERRKGEGMEWERVRGRE